MTLKTHSKESAYPDQSDLRYPEIHSIEEFYELVHKSKGFIKKIIQGSGKLDVKKATLDPDGKDLDIAYLLDIFDTFEISGQISGSANTYLTNLSNKDIDNANFLEKVKYVIAMDSRLMTERDNFQELTRDFFVENWYILGADYAFYDLKQWSKFDKHDSAAVLSRGNFYSLYQFFDLVEKRLKAKLETNDKNTRFLEEAQPIYILNKPVFPTESDLTKELGLGGFWDSLLKRLPLEDAQYKDILNIHTFTDRRPLVKHLSDTNNVRFPDKKPNIPNILQLKRSDILALATNNPKKGQEHDESLTYHGVDLRLVPLTGLIRSLQDTPEKNGSGGANALEKVEGALQRHDELARYLQERNIDPNSVHIVSDDRFFSFFDERLKDREELKKFSHVFEKGQLRIPGADMKYFADVNGFMELIHCINLAFKNMKKEYEDGKLDVKPDRRIMAQAVLILTPFDQNPEGERISFAYQGSAIYKLTKRLPSLEGEWDFEDVLVPVAEYNDHIKYNDENISYISKKTIREIEDAQSGYISEETHAGRAMRGLLSGLNGMGLKADRYDLNYKQGLREAKIVTSNQTCFNSTKGQKSQKPLKIKEDFQKSFANLKISNDKLQIQNWKDIHHFIDKADGFLFLPYENSDKTDGRKVMDLALFSSIYAHMGLGDFFITGKPWAILDDKKGSSYSGLVDIGKHLFHIGELGMPSYHAFSYMQQNEYSPAEIRRELNRQFTSWNRMRDTKEWDPFDKSQLGPIYDKVDWSNPRVAYFGSAHSLDVKQLARAGKLSKELFDLGFTAISGGGNTAIMRQAYFPHREYPIDFVRWRHIGVRTELTNREGYPEFAVPRSLPLIEVPTLEDRETMMYFLSDMAVKDIGGIGTLKETAMWAYYNYFYGFNKPYTIINAETERFGKTIRPYDPLIEYLGPELMEKLNFHVANSHEEALEIQKKLLNEINYGQKPDLEAAIEGRIQPQKSANHSNIIQFPK